MVSGSFSVVSGKRWVVSSVSGSFVVSGIFVVSSGFTVSVSFDSSGAEVLSLSISVVSSEVSEVSSDLPMETIAFTFFVFPLC